MGTPPFTAPGPFDRIGAIRFPGALFQLRIQRDDGYLYMPGGTSLSIHLNLIDGQWLFTGYGDTLDYQQAVDGLVDSFEFRAGCYRLELNRTMLKDAFGLTGSEIRLVLTTDGEGTLECRYPRVYADVGTVIPLSVGYHEITVPFWRLITETTHPTATSTRKTTTIRSSVPYSAVYAIDGGNALGRFQLPVLGVEWLPESDLSGWYRLFHVNGVCSQGSINIPPQHPPGIEPPTQPPGGADDRLYGLAYNVVLEVALSDCPGAWSATAIVVNTDFDFDTTIPYNNAAEPAFSILQDLGGQTPDLLGRSFQRTYEFQWDADGFDYDTGEWPNLHSDQRAVRIQSPATGFDRMTITPLPE